MSVLEELTAKIIELTNNLKCLSILLKKKSEFSCPSFEVDYKPENYEEIPSRIVAILERVRKGIQRDYSLPLPKLPDLLHWEIANEFEKYFCKNNSVEKMDFEKAPGLKSKKVADLFFIANGGKWYWAEIQTSLSHKQIKSKIREAIECSGNDRYEEYILIFPKEFQKESLYETVKSQITGNKYTDKLRVMLYADGDFETVIEPQKREVERRSTAELFGKSV